MGILLCEQNFRDVWIRNKSVRAEIGQLLRTHTHTTAAKLVVRIYIFCIIIFHYNQVRRLSLGLRVNIFNTRLVRLLSGGLQSSPALVVLQIILLSSLYQYTRFNHLYFHLSSFHYYPCVSLLTGTLIQTNIL